MMGKGRGVIVLVAVWLMACEGGSFKKRNCQSCETVTYGPQQTETSRITNRVCGDDQVSAHITANTFSNASVTAVTTCK